MKEAEPPEEKLPTQHQRRLPLHPEQKGTAKPPPRMQNQPQPHHPQPLSRTRISSGLKKNLARSCTTGGNTAAAPTATDVSETTGAWETATGHSESNPGVVSSGQKTVTSHAEKRARVNATGTIAVKRSRSITPRPLTGGRRSRRDLSTMLSTANRKRS